MYTGVQTGITKQRKYKANKTEETLVSIKRNGDTCLEKTTPCPLIQTRPCLCSLSGIGTLHEQLNSFADKIHTSYC